MLINFIKYFYLKPIGRSNNDTYNKFREMVIVCMPNFNKLFYHDPEYGSKWINFTTRFNQALKNICPDYYSYKIEHKAGRNHNYDYLFTFFNENAKKISEEKVEFKYNTDTISKATQYVSPMTPSKYLSNSFEEYHYDNYLPLILQDTRFPIPERNVYINTVGTNLPKCVKEAQELYYQGAKGSSRYTGEKTAVDFHNKCKRLAKESISNFIDKTDLNVEMLSQYLISSQNNKIYLLYKNSKFFIQKTNNDDFIIMSYSKRPNKGMYEATTKSGKKMKILLRWKNGNGIAFPAFQIS